MSLVIKNGTIVTATDVYKGDVEINDGVIVNIGDNIAAKDGDKVIDAEGQYVFPGGIDPHVHFEHPDYTDNFADGTRAAATGGITTVFSYIEPPLEGTNLVENFQYWEDKAKHSYIDYMLHPLVTPKNVDDFLENADTLKEKGLGTIKLFMSGRGIGLQLSDLELYKLMKKSGEKHMAVNVHCENGDVIDQISRECVAEGHTDVIYHGLCRKTYLEAEATRRAISIAKAADAQLRVVHISCKEAVDEVKKGQEEGVKVVGETCPQYLTKDISYLNQDFSFSSKFVCSPPLREKWNQDVLWAAINAGTITTAGSDHAPVAYEGMPVSKVNGKAAFNTIPNGCPGVEEIYNVLYSEGVAAGHISLQTFVALTSTNAAKQYGVYPQKGSITVGGDGDIVILDPNKTRTVSVDTQFQKCDFNAYEGMTLNGVITHVISRGDEIFCEGKFDGEADRGQRLRAKDIKF